MIQILYEVTSAKDSHEERARALMTVLPQAHCGNISTKPIHKPGLDTIILWGHGTVFSLCGKQASEMATLLKEWKKQNSSLKTIEIITCNARHSLGGNSYIQQLMASIGWNHRRSLTFKGLPIRMGRGAGTNSHSILLAHAPNKSWCYVTGEAFGEYKNDTKMMAGVNLVKAEAKNFGYDLAQAANKVISENPGRDFTLNYGYFNRLRDQLVKIK